MEIPNSKLWSFARQAGEKPLVAYHITRPSLTFYTRRAVPHLELDDADKLQAILKREGFLYIITKNKFLPDFLKIVPDGATVNRVEKGRVYSLLTVR